MIFPKDLTTSDWVDLLDSLPTRDERIIALATYHRRIEYDAAAVALQQLAAPATSVRVTGSGTQPVTKTESDVVRAHADLALVALAALPDYEADAVRKVGQ